MNILIIIRSSGGLAQEKQMAPWLPTWQSYLALIWTGALFRTQGPVLFRLLPMNCLKVIKNYLSIVVRGKLFLYWALSYFVLFFHCYEYKIHSNHH